MSGARLTIGITTRNRPEALRRCLRSLAVVAHLSPEVLVFDDASATPVSDPDRRLGPACACPRPSRRQRSRVYRRSQSPGARGVGISRVSDGRRCGVPRRRGDRSRAGVARGGSSRSARSRLRSANSAGARWDEGMQPSRSRVACYVPVVHRLCASASPRSLHGRWRVSGFVRVLRRGEGILPAPDRRRLSNRVSA